MRGEVTKNTRLQPEQRLFSYLSAVSDAASGRLSPAARSRFVDGLRDRIQAERDRRGMDVHTLDRILDGLGDPITLVDAEVQRDPDYQARLSARLSVRSADGPQVPIIDDLAELLAPQGPSSPYAPENRSSVPIGRVMDGPEICLDPDPFAPERAAETVGALGSTATQTMVLPELSVPEADFAPVEPPSEVARRLRALWLIGPREHPQEALAIALFVVGAILGQWVVLLVAALVACTSRFYTSVEKWTLLIGVPTGTTLVYAIGFWLYRAGIWGGHKASSADVLSGAANFFGTLPRIAAVLAALLLSWRLARGITRQM
ncbi:MAG TPA: hypothetical protein VGZ32_05075 [Actinocrinis sp.]|jgi:hypothetical protein|uniref:hypothetical protein n=1 Tax=Actinocrinis sp. TaxID=1920516 RepID=UPI002DDCD316|nr:hypothetical protein [Actinocrinis sp.]HEV3169684.1 hypothetical protein [Actinocrinis sp.]